MLNPHLCTAHLSVDDQPGLYCVGYRVPDRHGVFKKKIRPGSPPSRLEDAQNSHHRARRPAPAGRVSTHLERSVLCRRDQHQRRVFGVYDALVWLAGDDGVLRKKGKGAKTE
jgi:hypothetical protein